jgi:integrase/recombinase XerD
MSASLLQRCALLSQFEDHLAKARYSATATKRYLAVAGHFLEYLRKRHVPIEAVQPSHVTMYLRRELSRFSRRHQHAPVSAAQWRCSHTGGVHQFLRCIVGQWPPAATARTPYEAFCQALCAEYGCWLRDRRELAAETVCDLTAEAHRFLHWCGQNGGNEDLSTIAICDIDAYLQARASLLRRVSRKGVTQRLRCFLRFTHSTGRTKRDLAPCVMAPVMYALESIPSALRPEDIRAVVATAREDKSPKGLRDYVILLLLSTYGLRAGEIARLQLDDINWRGDRFCVHHTKTGAQSVLPLLPAVGEALLAYLRHGRPLTEAREIFIRARAPYRGFVNGSSLYTPIRRRIEAAGVHPDGKRGPHAFRHARAVGLLRSGTPMKIIGDLLGHRSAASTLPYLKLATEDLRDMGLDVPWLAAETTL